MSQEKPIMEMSVAAPPRPPRRTATGVDVPPPPDGISKEPLPQTGTTRRRFLAGLAGAGLGLILKEPVADLLRSLDQSPSIFDNNAQSGKIGDNNTVNLPLSEIQSQFPQQLVEKDNTLTMLFPIKTPPNASVSFEKSLSEFLPTEELQQEAKKNNIRNNEEFILPKDAVFIAPAKGHIVIMRGRQEFGEDPNTVTGAAFVLYDQGKDTTYVVKTYRREKATNFEPLIPLQSPENWSGTDWKKFPQVEQGQGIFRNTKDNQPLGISVEAYKGQSIGGGAATITKTLRLLTPQFFTKNEQGQSKLVVL